MGTGALVQRRHISTRKPTVRRPLGNVSLNTNVLVASQGRFLQLVKDIIDDQKKLVNKRVAAINRRNDLKAQLPFYLNAHDNLLEFFKQSLPEILQSDVAPRTKTQLLREWNNLEGSSNIIKQWQQHLEQDEDDVHMLESRCLAKETELAKFLRSLDPDSVLDDDDRLSDTILPTVSRAASDSSSSSSSTFSVRQKYLKTIGTINLLRDRIFNLESELQLEKMRRDERVESERPLKMSDEEFYADQSTRRAAIISEYWSTKAEMESLRRRCLEEGVKVQPANFPPDIDDFFVNKEDITAPAATTKKQPDEIPGTSRNIIRWVRHVHRMSQPESFFPTEPPMTDHEVEHLLPFPQYQRLQASTDMDRPTLAVSTAQTASRSHNFDGELPTARRRYSAPMLLRKTTPRVDIIALNYLDISPQDARGKRREHRLAARGASSEV
jgi:hypothetical protein